MKIYQQLLSYNNQVTIPMLLLGVAVFVVGLFYLSLDALEHFNLFEIIQNQPEAFFSTLSFSWGSLVALLVLLTFLTFIFVFPFAIVSAVNIAIRPRSYAYFLEVLISVLGAIPTIFYGFIGYFVLSSLFDINQISGVGEVLIYVLLFGFMVFPTILLTLFRGVKNIPISIFEGAYVLGASTSQILFRVYIPLIFNYIFASIFMAIGKVSAELTIIGIAVGVIANQVQGLIFVLVVTLIFFGLSVYFKSKKSYQFI